jgi:uncharacterized protein (UPF0276 family)
MRSLVGGSIRKALGPTMLDLASHWPVCEVVPENWNPGDPADLAALISLNESTTILLHSLSLNVLGPVPSASIVQRVREWSRILRLNMVTDHFCWSAAEDHSLGVFVPPIEAVDILQKRVRTTKEAVGITLGLENICLSSDDPIFSVHYHDALALISRNEKVPVLLDLENLRLDSIASNAPLSELLSCYDDVEVCGYHVAGSTVGETVLDTHDQKVPDETLELLLACLGNKPAPVIYERDYALDLTEIGDEVRRITVCVGTDDTML